MEPAIKVALISSGVSILCVIMTAKIKRRTDAELQRLDTSQKEYLQTQQATLNTALEEQRGKFTKDLEDKRGQVMQAVNAHKAELDRGIAEANLRAQRRLDVHVTLWEGCCDLVAEVRRNSMPFGLSMANADMSNEWLAKALAASTKLDETVLKRVIDRAPPVGTQPQRLDFLVAHIDDLIQTRYLDNTRTLKDLVERHRWILHDALYDDLCELVQAAWEYHMARHCSFLWLQQGDKEKSKEQDEANKRYRNTVMELNSSIASHLRIPRQ